MKIDINTGANMGTGDMLRKPALNKAKPLQQAKKIRHEQREIS